MNRNKGDEIKHITYKELLQYRLTTLKYLTTNKEQYQVINMYDWFDKEHTNDYLDCIIDEGLDDGEAYLKLFNYYESELNDINKKNNDDIKMIEDLARENGDLK